MPLTLPYRQAKSLYLRINHKRHGGKAWTFAAMPQIGYLSIAKFGSSALQQTSHYQQP